MLANYVFNAREAKRLYGIIGAGAIAGGIFGGYLTDILAPVLKSSNLLFICMFFLSCTIFILLAVWRKTARVSYRERIQAQKRTIKSGLSDNPFHLIFRSRHLKLLASLVAIGVVVANLIDYQYSAIASEFINDPDELTAFFGLWLSNLSVAALIIQILLTGRVMKSLGVAASLFFLPVGILAGAVAVLVVPALWSAIFVKISEGGFKQSINKAGLELLIMPVPALVKNQAKSVIDVFVDNFATGVGGILLIVLTTVLGLSVGDISIAIIALLVIWGFIIFKMRIEYVNSFREAIDKRTIDTNDQSLKLQDASLLDSILTNLIGNNDRQILHILDLLENISDDRVIPYLKELINNHSPEIKTKAIQLILKFDNIDLSSDIEKFILDENQEVRIEALRYLCAKSEDMAAALNSFLSDSDLRIRSAAILCAAREVTANPELLELFNLKSVLSDFLQTIESNAGLSHLKEPLKVHVARFIGTVQSRDFDPLIVDLLDDDSVKVVNAAIKSAGKIKGPKFVNRLISHLKTRDAALSAREALAEYGDEAISDLAEHFHDPSVENKVRQRIPKVFALIGSKKAIGYLYDSLALKNPSLRYEIIKALNMLKNNYPVIKLSRKLLSKSMLTDIEAYYKLNSILYVINRKAYITPTMIASGTGTFYGSKARRFLTRALQEKMDFIQEIIFRYLGLIYNAYLGITSNNASLRANSVEFIDNILSSDLKRYIIPMLDSISAKSLISYLERFYDFDITNEKIAIETLLSGNDDWLKICAPYFIGDLKSRGYLESVNALRHHIDPIVAETADYALAKIGRSGNDYE